MIACSTAIFGGFIVIQWYKAQGDFLTARDDILIISTISTIISIAIVTFICFLPFFSKNQPVNKKHDDALKDFEILARSKIQNISEDSHNKIVEIQTAGSEFSDKQSEDSVEKQLNELRRKIEQISTTAQNDTVNERVAFSNDVILAAYIQDLRGSLNRLESKILNRWDVAIIVFTIMGALSGLIMLALRISGNTLKP
jgi:hypothetical protein